MEWNFFEKYLEKRAVAIQKLRMATQRRHP
jgi:hypothetical protein